METVSFGGIFEQWPPGTSYTLETLCTAMIAASDNNATDLLIDVVGRERLETTEVNKPFLKTREMYLLKFGAARERAREYEQSSTDERVEILRDIKSLQIHGSPIGFEVAPRIEWFFSNRELVDVIKEVRNSATFTVNGGPFQGEYERVSFKAGREPGVLNYTAYLENAGTTVACSGTWNHEGGVDEDEFARIVKGAVTRCFRSMSA
jgi:hypothetical protein